MFPKNRSTGIGWLLSSSKKALLSSSLSFLGMSPSFKSVPSKSKLSQLLPSSLQARSGRFSLLSVFEEALLDFAAHGFEETSHSFRFSPPVSGMLSLFSSWITWSSPVPSGVEPSAGALGATGFSIPHTQPASPDFTRLVLSHFSLLEGRLPAALCEQVC